MRKVVAVVRKKNVIFLNLIARKYYFLKYNLDYIKRRIRRTIKNIIKSDNQKIYPRTLQLPITNKCNLNCVMCNIHQNDCSTNISIEEMDEILSSEIFKEIESVGINGGEPFILDNLDEYVEVFAGKLPKLKNIFIISNGTYKKNMLLSLTKIKKLCSKYNLRLNISFSIDGYGEVHDKIRGIKGTFDKLMNSIDSILENKQSYCDNINFICTVSSQNVYELNRLEAFASKKGILINYNIATIHERLKNYDRYDSFSLFADEQIRCLATEFFYKMFSKTKSEMYYSIFKYLENDDHVRVSDCEHLHGAITLTPEGNICYCATRSKVIGNVLKGEDNATSIFRNNLDYRRELECEFCTNCSHYSSTVSIKHYREFIDEKMKLNHRVKL